MRDLPASVVGETYTSTAGWDVLEQLVKIGNRHPGQEGEKEGATVIERAFESLCLDTNVSEFEIPGWWRGETVLELLEWSPTRTFDQQHQILAHPCTEQCRIESRLVDVGHGTPEEFESADIDGTIVLASSEDPSGYHRSISGMEKYARAAQGGAKAFILQTHVSGALPPTGSNEPNLIPALSVSREVGFHLVNYCKQPTPRVQLHIDSKIEPATSQNVEATVGPDTEKQVLVTAHVDSHDINDGARDNGVGCAVVVEVANQLLKLKDDLDTQVRFVTFGAEEIGLYGAYHWVETNDLDAVKCVINIDGAGGTSEIKLDHHIFEDVGEIIERAIRENLSLPVERVDDTTGDAWAFAQQGTPAVTVRTVPEEDHVSFDPGRGWGHTHSDTIDKLDRRDIRDLSIQVLASVVALASEDVETIHRNSEEIRETIGEQREWLLRAIDRWPYEE
jgi:Zn-dependent M28 family amino/carboxypeptidase